MKLWMVTADNHDYDAMSQWHIGVFDSLEKANEAALVDCKNYWKRNPGSKSKGFPNIEITEVILNLPVDNG